MNIKQRERMLHALPDAARQRVNHLDYSSEMRFRIASSHFHDNIFNLCMIGGSLSLVESIPAEIALRLHRQGLSFTQSDKFNDVTYVPLPNIPQRQIKDAGESLRTRAERAAAAAFVSPTRRNTRSSPVTTKLMENERLQQELAVTAAHTTAETAKCEAINKTLDIR